MVEPLGLGYISSYLKKNDYCDVKVYSAFFYSDSRIVKEAAYSDIVGMTANSPMMVHAKFWLIK